MSLVSGALTGLACKVSPGLCMTSATAPADVIPRAIEMNPEVLNSLESRQTNLIPNQQERYDRMQRLVGDVSRIEGDIAATWQSIESNGPYYISILDEIAQLRGYRDAEAMALEAETFMAPGEAEALLEAAKTDIEEMDLALDIQRWTSGALATFSGASVLAGKYRWVGSSDTYNYSKFWRKIYVPLKTLYGRARLLYLFKRGRISEGLYRYGMNRGIRELAREAADTLPSGVIKAKAFKFMGYLGGAVDFVAGIGSLIAEGIMGVQQRDDIREAVKNLLAARYSAYYLLHTVKMVRDMDAQIQAALDIRVTQQIQVNNGDLCYQAADGTAINKLAEVTLAFDDVFGRLTDEDVYNNISFIYDDGAWTNEDFNLGGILQWIDDHQEEDETADDGDEAQIPVPEESYHVTGSEVTAKYCNYIEFEDNKGSLWKLNGPVWTLQAAFTFSSQPLDIGSGSAGNSANTARNFRIRLDEIKRTDDSIFVQYEGFSETDGSIALSENPVIKIEVPGDGSAVQLRYIADPQLSLDGEGVVQVGGEGVEWTAFEPNQEKLSNLIPSNEFTAWKVNFEDEAVLLYECNIADGWRLFGTDGFVHSQIFERERKSGLITAITNTNTENFRVDVAAKVFNHTTYILEGGNDPLGPPGELVPHFEQLAIKDLEPRMIFT